MKNIESILQQAPENTTQEEVEALYERHNGNVVDILAELWDIKEVEKKQPLQNLSVSDLAVRNKLIEVRDICHTFDEEMDKYMQKIREKHIGNDKNPDNTEISNEIAH
jgi:hypothetical protein